MKRAPIVLVALAAVTAGAIYAWQARTPEEIAVLSGYVEGEALYFAAPVSASLRTLDVDEGDRVDADARLFAIDPATLEARRDQARANLEAAEARLADARKGERPIELAVIQARKQAAEANLTQAEATLKRVKPLVERGVSPKSNLDDAQAAYDAALANRNEVEKSLEAAEQGAREDQIRAAEADVKQATAALKEIEVQLGELTPKAPGAGRIEDVFYRPGEWVPANQPVVALLPDDRVRIRFFVPEAEIVRYQPGKTVRFGCDGCGGPLSATISYVSPRAEYTPPVIYSRSSREKLVFLVEARPDDPTALAPGLPVDVTPLEGTP
ncbi:HlyD family secretion protein [Amorphus sp. 3PC139-8]|uniref:HlyD family secretion protein n=1 Tax=Amorphus sp. 3PC139-8 TaxID=2735676 RepID=UPI00345CD531